MNDTVFKARSDTQQCYEFLNGYLILAMWAGCGLSLVLIPEVTVVFFSWAFVTSVIYVLKSIICALRSNYQLSFKEDLLLFQQGDAVLWTLPYARVSHIGKEPIDPSSSKFGSFAEQLFVYTTGEEKYLLPQDVFESSEIEAIQHEIELRKVTA